MSGWSHLSENGMATNPDPIEGGIIDCAIASGEWFVIFNHPDLPALDGFATKEEAFIAMEAEIIYMKLQELRK